MPALVNGIVDSVLQQLGAVRHLLIVGLVVGSLLGLDAAYAAEPGAAVDFWSGIFWPYFQYAVYLVGIFFLGKKIIPGILESRRDALRTRLSEAKEAVELARRKASLYEQKIASLQKEVDELRNQFISDGVRERNKIVSDAQKLAEQIIKDSERAALELVAKSKEQLRKELVDLAISSVEAQLTHERTVAMDSRLKAEALSGIRSIATH